jgi:uncharacterized protein (TIGR03437 family)
MLRSLVVGILAALCAFGHAAPTPLIQGPLRVNANALIDGTGNRLELIAVNLGDVETAKDRNILFKILRRRWNMNAVRIPVSVSIWNRDGEAYFETVSRVVGVANDAGLAVIVAARDDSHLPSPEVLAFWRIWAERFRDNTRVIFDVFDSPSAESIPGRSGFRRETAEWEMWLNGGRTVDGKDVVGTRQLVDAIRSVGATQVIAVEAFSDQFGFENFATRYWLPDPNVIYEIHPYFDRARTDADRERTFGYLAGRLHIFAGEFGIPIQQDSSACRSVPGDGNSATNLLIELILYFYSKRMSWAAATFEPGDLISNYETYANTRLYGSWTCGDKSDPNLGMGEIILLATTGDPTGFGELIPDYIVNAATGMTGPIAPGQILAIYGLEIGPYPGIAGSLVDDILPTEVALVRVLFDGVPAPIFYAYVYQVNVQVPYSVAGKESTNVQLVFDDVPSSLITLPVADASPGLFANLTREAKAFNQDGSLNSSGAPAAAGSVVVLFGTGTGVFSVGRKEGHTAVAPWGNVSLPVSVRIAGAPAEILYAGEAPGLIGVTQLNVKVPDGLTSSRAVTRPVELTVGSRTASSTVNIWVR